MTRRLLLAVLALAAVVAVTTTAQSVAVCDRCQIARTWTIDPEDYTKDGDASFPETDALKDRDDLGIAFSGGGTRSASATLGQLRGLARNGWLRHVRYMASISGGSWAALPYTYWPGTDEALLGNFQAPGTLDVQQIIDAPNGRLTDIIAHSGIAVPGLREAAEVIGRSQLNSTGRQIMSGVFGLLHQSLRESDRTDKTYTRLLDSRFITPLFQKRASSYVGWTTAAIGSIVEDNPHKDLTPERFVSVAAQRPFLIAGGVLIWSHPGAPYPLLAPIEYTPLYSGIRQQFGGRVGGTYLATWAYDSIGASSSGSGRVQITPAADGRVFTMSDIIASSGAAPQLPLVLKGRGEELLNRGLKVGAEFFPSYRALTTVAGRTVVTDPIPHGDGGFMDYYGIMPLLARQVRNIIVFANGSNDFDENNDLSSLFFPGRQTLTGDKSMNVVFESAKYDVVQKALAERRRDGRPAVFCDSGWTVKKNETYNIRHYTDLNICFVYNRAVPEWVGQISDSVRPLIAPPDPKKKQKPTQQQKDAGRLDNIPWYDTFEQQKPFVIKLTVAQVNMLSNLTAWTITNPCVIEHIEKNMPVLARYHPATAGRCETP